MNSLRSTERKLTQIAFKKSIAKPVNKRAIHIKSFDFLLSKRNKPNGVFDSCRPVFRRHEAPKIKLRQPLVQIDARAISSTVKGLALFNTDKPTARFQELQVKPIVPLTMPRFPKNGAQDLPSVTRILSATMPAASRYVLDRWKESMIRKLGISGFNKYQQDTFERGRILHALLATYLLGQGEPTAGQEELSKEVVSNLWNSIEDVVKTKIHNVRLVEHITTHPTLNYRGIVDCVAFYEDELVVIDFKTAEKPKKDIESLYDNPIQVSAYCAALNNDKTIPEHVIDRNINSGMVIVAYTDGSKASVYRLTNEQITDVYWKKFTERLDQYVQLEAMRQDQPK